MNKHEPFHTVCSWGRDSGDRGIVLVNVREINGILNITFGETFTDMYAWVYCEKVGEVVSCIIVILGDIT